MIKTYRLLGVSALFLAACQQASPALVARLADREQIATLAQGPEYAPEGTCWGQDTTQALIETVTERILVRPAGDVLAPAPDGAPTYRIVQKPALYQTRSQLRIVEARKDLWFQTPCPAEMDSAFVSTLQRALVARTLYRGAISGEMDMRTRRAVRKFQKQQGLNSDVLSLDAARRLGLVAYVQAEAPQ